MRGPVVAAVALLALAPCPARAQDPVEPGPTSPSPAAAEAPQSAGDSVRPEPGPRDRPTRYEVARPGLHVRLFRDYTLPAGERADGPVVVIGGSARIDGETRHDVVVVGGSLALGPTAVVDGRVSAVGTAIDIAPGAAVRGPVDRVVIRWPDVRIGVFDAGPGWTAVRTTLAALRLGLLLAVALCLAAIAPGWIRAIATRPLGASGLIGLTTEVAFVPALLAVTLALAISVVGIPLLGLVPFVLLIGAIVWAAGFAGVAARLGGLDAADDGSRLAPAGRLVRGYAAIVSVTVAGHLLALGPDWLDATAGWVRVAGLLVEYAAWTIGLGAGLASLFAARRVPALPPPAHSA